MCILIADDNQFVRRAIAQLLAQQEGWEVCAEASNSVETIKKTSELHPDLVLLDVSMPGTNGLETARVLKQKSPQTKILRMEPPSSALTALQTSRSGSSL